MSPSLKSILAFCLLFSLAVSAPAQGIPGQKSHVAATLLSEDSTIAPGQSFWVALRLKMDPRWHTYWKNPGDSGLPTTMKWTLPPGFQVGAIQWPYPERVDVSGLISFVYEGEALLLQQITPPGDLKPGQMVNLELQSDWLSCEEICVPGGAKLSLSLAVGAAPQIDSSNAADFVKARGHLPAVSANISVIPSIQAGKLLLDVSAPLPTGKVFFFPNGNEWFEPSAEQSVRKTDKGFVLEVAAGPKITAVPEAFGGVLVSEGGLAGDGMVKAVQVGKSGPADAGAKPAPVGRSAVKAAPNWTWGQLVGTAFSALLAGLVLNLMPCVFPVLSIKVLGFVRQSESEPQEVKRQGLLFGVGVLLSFLILAGIFLILRGTGETLGWAFQFQSPGFVVALAFLFFLMGLNLMGVFEVGTSLVGLSAASHGRNARWESFASGVLATVVATPCSGPFMGTALGFAVNLPPALGLVIFLCLGVGMALPYVLLSFFPALARKLPRPGAWMESFKQCMAFPLFATVVWLLWILGSQIEYDGIVGLMLAFVLVAMGAWIYGRWDTPVKSDGVRWLARLVAILFVAGGMVHAYSGLQPIQTVKNADGTQTDAYGQVWLHYSPELIEKLRAEGRPIFVDFTARWCASCQVNKKLVFSSQEVRDRIKELNMALVKGDWTNNDPVITKALESFGRAAVPLDIIYPKGQDSKPVILPELLTAGIVLDAMKGL